MHESRPGSVTDSLGVVGDALTATPELGKVLVDHAAQGLAELIRDLLRFELPIH